MKTLSARARTRLFRHHPPLAALAGALVFAFHAAAPGTDEKFRWSLATGYAALVLLAATLVLGPWNLRRGRPNPVSTDLRRDAGIWCALVALAHVAVGLQVHMGNMWLYFFREANGFRPRFDLFGFANDTGLAAALIVAALLALSNDRALRRLGKRRWKALQRLNYAAAALVLLHSVVYQFIEKRAWPFLLAFAVISLTAALAQAAGFLATKRAARAGRVGPERRAAIGE